MLLFCDVVEQLSSLAELSDQEANSISFPGFKKLDDVGMVQGSQDADLVLEGLVISNPGLLHSFDCNFLTYQTMSFWLKLNLPDDLFLARYTAPYPPLPNFFSKKYFSLILPTNDSIKMERVSALFGFTSIIFKILIIY